MPCSARASASCWPAPRASARIARRQRSASARLPRPSNVFARPIRLSNSEYRSPAAAGDRYSELLSRIGRAHTLLGRGNLADAERCLRAILADARGAGQQDAEARAEHGIGVALHHMGQPADAIPHVWRGFELYEDEESGLRALNDIGIMLLTD